MIPSNREEAIAAGRAAAREAVPLHDLTGHMSSIGIPLNLRGAWLCGFEAGLEDEGFDTDPDADGHGWERRALFRLD
ncbi:hypothetical protein [Sphingomonas sp. 3-13AW]|uniref:hypothetical protein n=1 Tax=Sphingomonas sp. 3-13AW TaxID=3050450 RepID=UPI003BB738A7